MASGGYREGSGRKPGIPNKDNREIKDLIRQALDNSGGADYLTEQARENPVAFMGLVGKCMPSNVVNNVTLSLESILDAAYARRDAKVLDVDGRMASGPSQLRQE